MRRRRRRRHRAPPPPAEGADGATGAAASSSTELALPNRPIVPQSTLLERLIMVEAAFELDAAIVAEQNIELGEELRLSPSGMSFEQVMP